MIDSRVMLISGTRKGIGKYLAHYYVNNGYIVIGCSRAEVKYQLNNYHHYLLDITDEPAVKKMFSAIRKTYGRLDVLINNAATSFTNHFLLSSIKTTKKIINTNLVGTILLCREAGKVMKNNDAGRIVNISTVATQLRPEGEAIYVISKSAVENLTKILSKEYAGFGITVNAVAPTPVKTDFIKGISEQKLSHLIEQQTIKCYTELEDISNVIDFFLNLKSKLITGQVLYLCGV